MTLRLSVFPSNWGWIGMAVSPRGLAGLTLPLPDRDAAMTKLTDEWPAGIPEEGDIWPEPRERVLRYLGGEREDFAGIPLDLPEKPAFLRKVWDICARIPYGETRTYAGLAAEAGSPLAFRAVGSAMASNPIPILVPCHRVVGFMGSLTGFGGGLPMKKRMLEMESEVARG